MRQPGKRVPAALTAILVLLGAPAAGVGSFGPVWAAGKAVAPGTKATVREQWIACKAPEDEDRVQVLFAEQDKDALYRFFIEHMGPCAMLDPGTIGTVEQTSSRGTLCVRPMGQPYCMWLPSTKLKP